MYTSVRWLNEYLDPDATPEEQADAATRAGFPLEGSETVAVSDGEDVRQDFEMTSNRGDCVCHLGLAREIAAITGRTLRPPAARPEATGPAAAETITVTNEDPDGCPLYTARVIRGVTVGPSPAWLADRLRARGDIPRNNIVDATNYVLFELGQPTHVFDLATLKGSRIVIRRARVAEPFLPIGEGASAVKLTTDDLVIADAERAVAIAGVKGGALTAVTEGTTDLLIEAATFDPVTVRTTSRRHGIASDSSYRFERGVHPGQIAAASDRLTALILDLAGGTLLDGVVEDGRPVPERGRVSMRPERCRRLLGVPIDNRTMTDALDRLGFEPSIEGDRIHCRVPIHRGDIEREIDLIEEVARMHGLDRIPVADTIRVRVAAPQPRELARRAVLDTLVGLGFIETITHSLVTDTAAEAFLPPGLHPLRIDDDRAKAEPVLRPSILPSLLRVYRHNCDHGQDDVRLFETASTFARTDDAHLERTNLALLHPADDAENPLRHTLGVIDRLVELLRGPGVRPTVEPLDAFGWLDPGAAVRLDGAVLGTCGLVADATLARFDLAGRRLCVAELGLPALYDVFPPEIEAGALPSFPDIERDISIIVDEAVTWADVRDAIAALDLDGGEAIEFVTTFRGTPIEAGRKSLTLRLRFRAPDRTLRHEEVDPQVKAVVDDLTARFDAAIRQ